MKLDRQDVLLIVGVLSLVGGIAMRSVPAALVVVGVLCLAAVVLIERTKPRDRTREEAR